MNRLCDACQGVSGFEEFCDSCYRNEIAPGEAPDHLYKWEKSVEAIRDRLKEAWEKGDRARVEAALGCSGPEIGD